MASISVSAPIAHPRALETIILGGLVAGLLDGMDAIVFYGLTMGVAPVRIFQYIAAGLIGPSSYQGGWRTVVLGVLLHFTVAVGAATVYYIAGLRFTALVKKPFVFGSIFGLVVYTAMYYVVVPLSAVPKSTRWVSPLEHLNELIAHVFFVGIPIALAAFWSTRKSLCRATLRR